VRTERVFTIIKLEKDPIFPKIVLTARTKGGSRSRTMVVY
jgi:hypothetical protein